MPILKFKIGVHLAKTFSGIETGEPKPVTIAKGTTKEIKNEELAKHLIAEDLAEFQIVEKSTSK